MSENFKAFEGQPLALPTEAAGPKAEYLEWHRRAVVGKQHPSPTTSATDP